MHGLRCEQNGCSLRGPSWPMAARPNSTTMDGPTTNSESHVQLATLITATRAVTAQQIGANRIRGTKGSRLNCRRRRQRAAAAILRAAAVAHKAHDAEDRRTGRPEGCAASQAGTARAQQQQMPMKLSAHSEVSRSHGDAQVERHHLPARRRPPCHRSSLQ